MTALTRADAFKDASPASLCAPQRGVQVDPVERLHDLLLEQRRVKEAAQTRAAEQMLALVGSNDSPPLVQPFGIDAPWFQFADADQIAHLAQLHVRINRRKLILADDYRDQKTIRDCCIRRMRRAQGKN